MSDVHNDFSKEFTCAITEAFQFAQDNKYEYVTVDNLMVFIAQTSEGRRIFDGLRLDLEDFKKQATEYMQDNIPKMEYDDEPPQATISLNKTLRQTIIMHKAADKKDLITEGWLFIALLAEEEEDLFTVKYLKQNGITRFDVMNFLSHGKAKEVNETNSQPNRETKENSKTYLDKYTVSLNQKAKDNLVEPLIGNEVELERIIEILVQRRKNNPIIVGDAGVGKTALAEGLAQKIVRGQVPNQLKDFQVYSLDMGSLIAGAKYRGDFEDRLKGVIKEVAQSNQNMLFIDEIHSLIGTGSGNGAMGAADILKPYLTTGELKVMGATTYDEFKKIFEKDGALSRRFQKVTLEEPTEENCIKILKGIKHQYEKFHGVVYKDSALEAAVKLTVKYISDKRLPDKAIDAIDMAGSSMKLSSAQDKTIGEEQVARIIAKMAKIPVDSIQEKEKDKLKHLSKDLHSSVFGQDEAIEKTVNNIILSRLNLTGKNKPIASYLFAGPSGVGKTELCKVLSSTLGIPLLRFDMSEYMEKHAVARLIGAPPGYVGYEEGGQLTDAIRKNPHAVLLLDEIEKAHSDMYNILLQVMDYGVLTDNTGRKADFKNIILVMTTNAGAQEISKNTIGFNSPKEEEVKSNRDTHIKKMFSPEFYNRLDSVMQFNSLTKENVLKVVDKQLKILESHLLEKKVLAFFTPELREFIVEKGFDPKLGARPIERYIEQNISQKFANEIVLGDLSEGGEVKVVIEDGTIKLEIICNYAVEDNKGLYKQIPNPLVEDIIHSNKNSDIKH